jgi:hypothetical protein
VQCEPRGQALVGEGLGGYYDDFQNPNYDVLIWSQGSFGDYSYADTTRLELGIYLDQGGNLLSGGDEVAFHLGTGGDNADSTIGFLGDYLGVSFPSATDTETTDRVLSVTGVTGSSMDGITLGIYGECPIRRGFDRLTLATPASLSENFVLMNYADGGAGDNGRAAIIKNVRFEDALHNIQAGVAVHSGFDISAFLSDFWRACYMGNVFEGDFGLNIVKDHSCSNPNVGAPVVANAFGFGLSAAAPNPFKDNTRIEFSVPSRTHVSIEVYNILGQKVRTLVNEKMEANSYVRDWDGRSDAGAEVSSGIYFYKMVAGEFSATKKAVLLK